jgi:hypothetical protein
MAVVIFLIWYAFNLDPLLEVFKQAIEQTVETAKNSVYDAIRYSPAARRKLGIN